MKRSDGSIGCWSFTRRKSVRVSSAPRSYARHLCLRLAPFLDERRLTKGQRRVVRQILLEQLDVVLARIETPAQDLQALFKRLHDVSYAQALQDDIEEAREGMAAMFDDLGLVIDVPELRADMTQEDLAAAAARFADELCRAEESAPEAARAKTKRELRGEQRSRRQEQLRKDSLSAVYRRLVKELHPDLEAEPAERERKNRIIQDVTAAYARRDLHALLQLELEWLEGAGDAARMSHERLQAYTDMLKQQARELNTEVHSLRLHPRYAALLVDTPFGLPMVVDGPGEVEQLDFEIEQIRSALERLSSSECLDEVRGAIREYREAEKRHARGRRRY